MNTIQCPHCKREVKIDEAIGTQIHEALELEMEAKYKQQIEVAKKEAAEKSSQKLKEQFEFEAKRLQEDAKDKDERIQKLTEQLTELTIELRQSRKEKEEAKLQMQKQLALEEEKIRLDAGKKAEEEIHLKMLEKDKMIEDTRKELEDTRRKLMQGSQQTQGEAFELEFESMLQQHYPNDEITPVGKGIKGGDVIQKIIDRNGNYVGKILWELKNTKTWSEGWIDKLKGDQRSIGAEEAVLISEVIPNNMKNGGFRNNVYVTQRACVTLIADMLRAKLIQMYYIKNSVQAKDEKMEILYAYLSGTEFKHRIEAIIEAFTNMQTEIEKEKRYFSNKWARDEKNIRQVIDNTYGMHGDLKGIIGTMLPQVKGLDLLELAGGEKVVDGQTRF
jgi:hypothetical protein